jgi:hypothetical protein
MRRLLPLALLLLALPAAADWPEHLSLYGIGARSAPNKHGQVGFESLNLELSGRMTRSLDFGLVLAPTFLSQPTDFYDEFHTDENVRAVSLSPLLRHWFAPRGSVQPYIELSSGPIYASKRVPETTSHFNFISQLGGGVILTRTRVPVILGIRVFHISNAGYAERNPGINFTSVLAGVRFH